MISNICFQIPVEIGSAKRRILQGSMHRFLSILILTTVLPVLLWAQQYKGRVVDASNGTPIASVLVRNLRTGSMWLGDSTGNVAFSAGPGDEIRFEHPSYNDFTLQIQTVADLIAVRMERTPIMLQGVEVISPYLRFSKDSAFMREYFHKEIGYSGTQVKLDMNGGVGTSGLISELALQLSGRKKRAKQFVQDLQMLEAWRYEAIRYTPELVMVQTGLDDSTARAFILKHPMPMDLLRSGSEMALKMWIRDEFRASGGHIPESIQGELSETFKNPGTDSLANNR